MYRIISTLLSVLMVGSVFSQSKSIELDSIFSLLHENGRFNGSILIAEKGKPIFAKSIGLADTEKSELLSNTSIYKLNSITKQFTAMGIIILKSNGKIGLEDNLSKYVPELKFYETVTIRHLLTHTHGIPDYNDLFEEYWDKTKIASNSDILKLYQQFMPEALFNPGEKFNYGGIGYELLAIIIERISNQTYGDYLTENVFTPLNMTNTFDYHRFKNTVIPTEIARGYVYSDSLKRHEKPELLTQHSEVVWGNGIYGSGNIHNHI